MADGASVPALGLSNKAVYMDELKANDLVISEKKDKDQYSESYFTPQKLTGISSSAHLYCLGRMLSIQIQASSIELGAIHKGRPHKSTIFSPPPPCPHLSTFGIPLPPPPYRTSAMPFHFKEISLKLLCYL